MGADKSDATGRISDCELEDLISQHGESDAPGDSYIWAFENQAALLCALRALLAREGERVAKDIVRRFGPGTAHTYASENADLYRGFENGIAEAANVIRAMLGAPAREETTR